MDAMCQSRKMVGRCLKMHNTLCISFIDYTDRFDRVKHDILVEILSKTCVPNREMNIIENIYLQQKTTLCYDK